LLEPGVLHEIDRYFSDHPGVDAVYGNAIWMDESGNPLREQREIPFNRFVWLYTYNYIPGMSMFWRKSVYDKVGGLNPEFDLAMDTDLWIRFAEVGKIAHVHRVWSRMRFYPQQKNRRLRGKSDDEDIKIRRRYGVDPEHPFHPFKRGVALLIRVVWKLLMGCYPLNYRRNMGVQ
jgi:GT2 family glycosyltransferase